MSSITKTLKPIRILALPLTKAAQPERSKILQQRLIYYHFQIAKPMAPSQTQESRIWGPEGGWSKWATGKAAQVWAGFGKAKEGSWKFRVFQLGERLVDRIDFEELALKGIDPSFGPSIRHPDFGGHSKDDIKNKPPLKIPLLYPPSIQNGQITLSHLTSLVHHRGPNHRRGFYTWMFLAPLTTPFILIPLIPNLPFFFCVWRSWHHYRAYRASEYVQALLDSGSIQPEPSPELDELYKEYGSARPPSDLKDRPESQASDSHSLLLTRDAVPALLESFSLKSNHGGDIYRALEQAKVRIQKESS